MTQKLKELVFPFGKLGVIAFGGPAAHIAMIEQEVVKRRSWITHEYFLDLLGVTNLIPGPNSTEMAMHIGYVRAGWRGLVVAGLSFILPAVLVTLGCAYAYVAYGNIPQAGQLMWGIRAGVIAIILAAMLRLGKPMVKKPFMLAVCSVIAVLSLLHIDELLLLLGGGVVGLAWVHRQWFTGSAVIVGFIFPVLLAVVPSQLSSNEIITSATIVGLGLFFLKIGSILYGSGYVLVAFLQHGLVDARHWLTQSQLLDAVAVGQFTPGPVLSTATFIGYVILGIPGAAVATIGIFLPSFIFVSITGRVIPRLAQSTGARGFLDGVNAAALGLMLAVCIVLGSSALTSVPSWMIFSIAIIVLSRWNVNPAWIVVGSAVIGWMISIVGVSWSIGTYS